MSPFRKGFLYRRLAKFIPCVLPGIGKRGLSLESKYDIASARDVFFSAHYWRLFEFLKVPPQLVVDLGAHCGHFSVLCHLVSMEKFGCDIASYVLVEPVKSLLDRATSNLAAVEILQQSTIHRGLVGRRGGSAFLHTDQHNLLASKIKAAPSEIHSSPGVSIPYVDLNKVLPPAQPVDVLKIDIEGSEHSFLCEYADLLARTRVLLIELHGNESEINTAHNGIIDSGLIPVSTPIHRAEEAMRIYVSGFHSTH